MRSDFRLMRGVAAVAPQIRYDKASAPFVDFIQINMASGSFYPYLAPASSISDNNTVFSLETSHASPYTEPVVRNIGNGPSVKRPRNDDVIGRVSPGSNGHNDTTQVVKRKRRKTIVENGSVVKPGPNRYGRTGTRRCMRCRHWRQKVFSYSKSND